MVIAGLFLKANEVRMVSLSGTRESHELVAPKVNKLTLNKSPTREEVSKFVAEIKAYCGEHQVELIVMNRRASKGQGAGGAGTFLMEGVILASSMISVDLVHPATIRATDKRTLTLKDLKPKTVDLGKAYDLAFELLN
ncbi:Protein of unknown function (DUF3010) [Shewanella psychrophila]|uniref:DUF3010 family protein n=1 Tax=Shewanella psychrophila TaxID=225848 RepID=A0A1S6HQX2_9GAMM|nr:DUF3010 family protein [Shewanella psychrophila]AQS37947.1 Protein of unknown function (DUF3010) [Shewanella psychrophila]